MQTIFEDKFIELQSEFISLALEVTSTQIDELYMYISIERSSQMVNAFARVNSEIKTLNELTSNRSLIVEFLKMATGDVEKIKQLCFEYQQPVPTEMKLSYSVESGRYHAEYQYEPVSTVETGVTSGEKFLQWLDEQKNKR